jgi:hypothetical protein
MHKGTSYYLDVPPYLQSLFRQLPCRQLLCNYMTLDRRQCSHQFSPTDFLNCWRDYDDVLCLLQSARFWQRHFQFFFSFFTFRQPPFPERIRFVKFCQLRVAALAGFLPHPTSLSVARRAWPLSHQCMRAVRVLRTDSCVGGDLDKNSKSPLASRTHPPIIHALSVSSHRLNKLPVDREHWMKMPRAFP